MEAQRSVAKPELSHLESPDFPAALTASQWWGQALQHSISFLICRTEITLGAETTYYR